MTAYYCDYCVTVNEPTCISMAGEILQSKLCVYMYMLQAVCNKFMLRILDVTCKDRPTMEQLMKIMIIGDINIATKWHELGIMLLHSYSVIQEIEANRNDVRTCCRIMFEKWLQMKPDASWNELVTALNYIEMKAAADFISKQFKSGNEHI